MRSRTTSDAPPRHVRLRTLLVLSLSAAMLLAAPREAACDPPFGLFETPTQNALGVQGGIAVTGWALDDGGVSSVKIYRSCLSFESPGNCRLVEGYNVVYVGTATFVTGVRPDVERAYAQFPQASRAGWGYMLLSNMLPDVVNHQMWGGEGTLALYAFATDTDGNVTLLGRGINDHTPTTITLANATIARPFGAIDTPGQGQTIGGTFANWGWALTPDSNTIAGEASDIFIPTDGSKVRVFVDGAVAGTVSYDICRGTTPTPAYCDDDVASIFGNPTPRPLYTPRTSNPTKHRNLDAGRGAIGVYVLDTTKLATGLHTIVWSATDSNNRVDGIGSRYFWVANGPGIALSGDLAVGGVTLGTTKSAALTVSNPGSAPLDVTAISLPAGFSASWTAGSIPAGGSQAVTVTFAPTLVLNYGGTIAVTSNKAYGTSTIAVSGNGTPPAGFAPTFPAGGYVVGTDIYPGRYYADPTYNPLVPTSGCFWERRGSTDWSKHSPPDVITNEFVGHDAAQVVVDVLPTDVAFAADSDCGTWTSTPLYGPLTTIRRGTWLVGSQIQPGTYRATASVGCYWARLRSFSGTPDAAAVIDDATIGSAGVVEVTISAADAGFRNGIAPGATADCGEWTLVAAADGAAGDPPAPAGAAVATARDAASTPPRTFGHALAVEALPAAQTAVRGRTGFDLEAPLTEIVADAAGSRYIQIEELGRIELELGPVETGFTVANGELRDLPVGSRLDSATGSFTWMAGPGYLGMYRLAFIRQATRIDLTVTVRPKTHLPAPGREIRMYLDLPRTGQTLSGGFLVAGWALDPRAAFGSGIGTIHVWARRRDVAGSAPFFLGAAEVGGNRPDVARVYGAQFDRAGFGLWTPGLPPGRYDITAYVWNSRTARWEDARTVPVSVR